MFALAGCECTLILCMLCMLLLLNIDEVQLFMSFVRRGGAGGRGRGGGRDGGRGGGRSAKSNRWIALMLYDFRRRKRKRRRELV
jgi:uncharacterized membrane protein YgcG